MISTKYQLRKKISTMEHNLDQNSTFEEDATKIIPVTQLESMLCTKKCVIVVTKIVRIPTRKKSIFFEIQKFAMAFFFSW